MDNKDRPPRLDWKGYLVCLRHNRGISQVALSKLVEVSEGAVGTWENEISRPRLGVASKLIALDPGLAESFVLTPAQIAEADAAKRQEKNSSTSGPGRSKLSETELLGADLRKLVAHLGTIASQMKTAGIWDSEIRTLTRDVANLDKRFERIEHGLRAIMALEKGPGSGP